MVLFSHQFAVLGMVEPPVAPRVTWGALGVCIFFVVSGFLVTQSWLRDPHVGRFSQRRFLRIWPGLIVAVCLTVLVLGPLVTTLAAADYFRSGDTWRYFKTLLLNIKYVLPGVFESNPYPRGVNGSLWTIPVEVRWYVLVALAGVLRLVQRRYLVLGVFLVMGFYHFVIYRAETNPHLVFFREYGLFFMYGALLQLFHEVWSRRPGRWAVVLIGLALVLDLLGHRYAGIALALPFVVIWIGLKSTPVLCRFGRFGDLSYGIYIYAFPLQQLMVWLTGGRYGYPITFALSAAATVACAFVSWHVIENPALSFKPRRKAAAPARVEASRA